MLSILTIASTVSGIEKAFDFEGIPQFAPIYQGGVDGEFPVFYEDEGSVQCEMATWMLKYARNKYVSRLDFGRVLKNKRSQVLFRGHRCAIPVNCFFGERDGKVYLIRLLKSRVFWLGGVLQYTSGKGYEFAVLMTEPADILQDYMTEMPVLGAADRMKKWLKRDDLYGLMLQGDKSQSQWFDIFEVNPSIKDKLNERDLLTPVGRSIDNYNREEIDKIQKVYAANRGKRGK